MFLISLFAKLWLVFRWFGGWFWQVVIVGGILGTVIVGLLIFGVWSFPPPNQWRVVQIAFEYLLWAVVTIGVAALLVCLSYFTYRFQLQGVSKPHSASRLARKVSPTLAVFPSSLQPATVTYKGGNGLAWLALSIIVDVIALSFSSQLFFFFWLLIIAAASAVIPYGWRNKQWDGREKGMFLLGMGLPLAVALIVFVQGLSSVGVANVLGINQTYEFAHVKCYLGTPPAGVISDMVFFMLLSLVLMG